MWLMLTLIIVLCFYHFLNIWRLIKQRMPADHLRRVYWQTFAWLFGLQVLIFGVGKLVTSTLSTLDGFYLLAGLQIIAALVLAWANLHNYRKTTPPTALRPLPDHELPTLSVAIPARNETDALQNCLQSLVASDYPKLEILVLDDCSQNKHTPGIIKDFAQSGVRFVSGKVPPEDWLAKNYAYEQLCQQANGDILLFCGVDTSFEPGSFRSLVTIMLRKHKDMISVMPRNQSKTALKLIQLLTQPNRYAWEIGLPRPLRKRPAVLSTCWLIRRKALLKAGSFGAVKRSILPEGYLARYCAASSGKYLFIRSEGNIGLTSFKTPDEQRDTSVRMRYPQLHRRPELVALISIGELGLFVWPFITMLVAAATHFWLLAGLSAACYVITSISHSEIINLSYRRFVLRGLFILPIAAIYDVWLLNYSMWRYESGEVLWKGRNICLPVMQVIAKLPNPG